MSKTTEQHIAESKAIIDEFSPFASENGAQPFTTFDDFLAAVPKPQEEKVIGGRLCFFEGMGAEQKDNLIAAHSRDDGMGNVTVENKGWRTNVIKQTWRVKFGGPLVLDTPEKAQRFYTTVPAQIEQQMYEVAARVSGLADVEKRRKNSDGTDGTSISRSSA
jgi:hypothetical protein